MSAKRRRRSLSESEQKVKSALGPFADIMLVDEAEAPILAPPVRAALFEWMAEIGASDALAAAKVKPRRRALLVGPPGCGKTTFAHHLAARLGLPLACIRSESLVDKYVGSTGQNIGHLFDAMRVTEGEVVILLDEVDALAMKRIYDQGASVERSNSLNVMLRRIEFFDGVLMAATNRGDIIDPAFWRRFDMHIEIALPGQEERFAILKKYGLPFAFDDDDLDLLAVLTEGASPALLRGLIECVKRELIMWPKLGRSIDEAFALFDAAIGTIKPPPEYEQLPPLWESRKDLRDIGRNWPPQLVGPQ